MAYPSALSAEQLDRVLAEVYRRPEFATRPPSRLGAWLSHAWEVVKRFLAGLFPDGMLAEGSGRALAWAFIAVLAITALSVAVHLALRATGLWRARERSRRVWRERSVAPGATDALHWEEAARRAAAAGRWREAALALYPALLLRLAERGALRYDPAKTPGDYRRETRADEPAHRALSTFLRAFEPLAFGGRPVGAPQYEQLRVAACAGGARA